MKLPDRRILGLHISPQKGVDKKIIIYFDNLQIFENLYIGGSPWSVEALDPQPSNLASLGLIVPHNAQRKYAPYVISISWLGHRSGG